MAKTQSLPSSRSRPKLVIRQATIDDLKAISSLNLKLFESELQYDSTYNKNWTYSKTGQNYFKQQLTSKKAIVYLAVIRNKIVGYICGSLDVLAYRIPPKTAEIDQLFVLPKFRNKKIGHKLIKAFTKKAISLKASRLRVNSTINNQIAINFYKKNHFRPHTTVFELEL